MACKQSEHPNRHTEISPHLPNPQVQLSAAGPQTLVKFLQKGPGIYHLHPASGGTSAGRELAKLGEMRYRCCKARVSLGERAAVPRSLLQREDGLALPSQVRPGCASASGTTGQKTWQVSSLVTEILYTVSLRLSSPDARTALLRACRSTQHSAGRAKRLPGAAGKTLVVCQSPWLSLKEPSAHPP